MRIGLGLFVDEAAREGVRRVGEGAEPQLAEEGPLTTLELPDAHDGAVKGLLGRHEDNARRLEGERASVETAEELDL